MNVIGWNKILPQLACFYSLVKRLPADEPPLSLFLVGWPGSNKTKGLTGMSRGVGFTAEFIDSGQLDEINELAGVADIGANVRESQAKVIPSDLVRAVILIIDEFLNLRPHVQSQARHMMHGNLWVFGKKQEVAWRGIVSGGNLQEHMLQGDAVRLDTPTADRWLFVVTVPSLLEMEADDMAAVIERRKSGGFERDLKQAIEGIEKHYQAVERDFGAHATRYVCSIVKKVSNEARVEGRRGQIMRDAVIAAMALQRAQPDRQMDDTIYTVVHDMLVYGKLSGLKVSDAEVKSWHDGAMAAMGNMDAETMVAEAPTLDEKIAVLIANLPLISAPTKAAVFGEELLQCGDLLIKLACKKLIETPVFAGEPAHLKDIIESVPLPGVQFKINAGKMRRMSQLTPANAAIFEAADGDEQRMSALTLQVDALLLRWGLKHEDIAAAPAAVGQSAAA